MPFSTKDRFKQKHKKRVEREKRMHSMIDYEPEEDIPLGESETAQCKIRIWDIVRKRTTIDPKDLRDTKKLQKKYNDTIGYRKGKKISPKRNELTLRDKLLSKESYREYLKEHTEVKTKKDKSGRKVEYLAWKTRKLTDGEKKYLADSNQRHNGNIRKTTDDFNKRYGEISENQAKGYLSGIKRQISKVNKTKTSTVMETKKTPQKKVVAKTIPKPKQKLSTRDRKKLGRANRKAKKD
jgi:hypothetical protein